MSKLKTILLLTACVSLGWLTGCSLAGRKSADAQPSPSPAAQRDAGHVSESLGSATPSTTESKEQTSATATDSSAVIDQLHTPEKGSLERQGMMDALRTAFDDRRSGYYQPHRGTITFVVNYLKAHNGWAVDVRRAAFLRSKRFIRRKQRLPAASGGWAVESHETAGDGQ